jgi:hypothetical protein
LLVQAYLAKKLFDPATTAIHGSRSWPRMTPVEVQLSPLEVRDHSAFTGTGSTATLA